jgi:hypothetical protein
MATYTPNMLGQLPRRKKGRQIEVNVPLKNIHKDWQAITTALVGFRKIDSRSPRVKVLNHRKHSGIDVPATAPVACRYCCHNYRNGSLAWEGHCASR